MRSLGLEGLTLLTDRQNDVHDQATYVGETGTTDWTQKGE